MCGLMRPRAHMTAHGTQPRAARSLPLFLPFRLLPSPLLSLPAIVQPLFPLFLPLVSSPSFGPVDRRLLPFVATTATVLSHRPRLSSDALPFRLLPHPATLLLPFPIAMVSSIAGTAVFLPGKAMTRSPYRRPRLSIGALLSPSFHPSPPTSPLSGFLLRHRRPRSPFLLLPTTPPSATTAGIVPLC